MNALLDKRDRVCARCYGQLQIRRVEGVDEVYCPACGAAWGGTTILERTAEQRGQKAIEELWEVTSLLPDLFPNPHRGKTTSQILAELGF